MSPERLVSSWIWAKVIEKITRPPTPKDPLRSTFRHTIRIVLSSQESILRTKRNSKSFRAFLSQIRCLSILIVGRDFSSVLRPMTSFTKLWVPLCTLTSSKIISDLCLILWPQKQLKYDRLSIRLLSGMCISGCGSDRYKEIQEIYGKEFQQYVVREKSKAFFFRAIAKLKKNVSQSV